MIMLSWVGIIERDLWNPISNLQMVIQLGWGTNLNKRVESVYSFLLEIRSSVEDHLVSPHRQFRSSL